MFWPTWMARSAFGPGGDGRLPTRSPRDCLLGVGVGLSVGFVDEVDQLRQSVEPVLTIAIKLCLECRDACIAVLA
jgi:hypothetical protein